MKFIIIVLNELLTHKWFKSLVLASVLTFLYAIRETVISFFNERELLLWFSIFSIFYIRFFVAEFLMGKEYFSKEIVTIEDWKRSIVKHKVQGRDKGSTEIYFQFNWNFKNKLPIIPVVYLDALNVVDSRNWFKKHKLDIIDLSDSHVLFEIRFFFQGAIPRNEDNFTSLVKEITLVASAEEYSLESRKGKILNFLSVKLKTKYPYLC